MKRAVRILVVALVAAGCGVSTGPPSPTPADIPGIVGIFRESGITAANLVSGDAGCADHDLTQLAVAMDLVGLDQEQPTRVHVYLFRDQDAYDRLRPKVDQCLAAFVTDPDALGLIEAPPYLAAGAGPWAPSFNAALRDALTKASGQR